MTLVLRWFLSWSARRTLRAATAGLVFICVGPGWPSPLLGADESANRTVQPAFKLKEVDPAGVVYAADRGFSLSIGLDPVQPPNHLELRINQGPSLPLDLVSNDGARFTYAVTNGAAGSRVWCILDTNRSRLAINVPSGVYGGHLNLAVRTELGFSNTVETTFARCSSACVRWFAVLLALAFLAIPILLARSGRGRALDVSWSDRKPLRQLLAGLILDRETSTYSLSKFQLYLWLLVSIVSYAYFILAKWFIQGSLEFCDVPENLPSLFLVSAGTPAAAMFITNARGPKGAGDPQPSLADLVSSGGVVAADRFQLLVWTLLGSAYFLFLSLSIDPAAIEGLPKLPPELLDLMGLSSAGYLAGKFARKPGPVIDDIGVDLPPDGSLKLTVRGRILSPSATFKIDDQEVTANCFLSKDQRPEIKEPEDATKPEITGKILILVVDKPCAQWKSMGDHVFAISNPDGQNANWPFNIGSGNVAGS